METQGTDGTAGSQLLRNFMALKPPEFYGGRDSLVAESWMKAIERSLRTMGFSSA